MSAAGKRSWQKDLASRRLTLGLPLIILLTGCLRVDVAASAEIIRYDVVLRNGTIYDGSGGPAYRGDIGIKDGRITFIGQSLRGSGAREIDASKLAVAPGFINVLSWANESLLVDGRGESDVKQGITLEIMGEGRSMGPLTSAMKKAHHTGQDHLDYPITWDTLGGYFDALLARGVSPNVASFVGATTVRTYVLGEANIDPSPGQLAEMRRLVRHAMREGALGVGSALIFPPGSYAETPELMALTSEAALCGGGYISHIRSEGHGLLEAVDEVITIARATSAPVEIYHLKAAGQANWPKLEAVIKKIEAARAQGQRVTANMYTYTAGATGLSATLPLWVQEGGFKSWLERIKDQSIRARAVAEMRLEDAGYENLLRLSGGPDNVLLIGVRNPQLRPLIGKSLAEIARGRGTSAEELILDLILEDQANPVAAYFQMSEENVRRQVALPWMSFGSDAAAPATEGIFLRTPTHPRAYGTFARLLGKYVREQKVVPLADAIRRLTSLPASNFKVRERGSLKVGYHADIVLFDPDEIADRATYTNPHQYATGVRHVFVNGVAVIEEERHTGAKPGQIVRGPGWRDGPNGGACTN